MASINPGGHGQADVDAAAAQPALSIIEPPLKRSYEPGEAIDYAGLEVGLGDVVVTDCCTFSVSEGTAWSKHDKSLSVTVTLEGAGEATFELKRKRRMATPLLCFLLAVAVAGGIGAAAYFKEQPLGGETGSYLIPKGDMTDEEAQALVNEMAEASRITVSIAPDMVLREDGALRVNFIVVEPNNGYSERLEVEQDGNLVYRSGIVDPGYKLEWGISQGARTGTAVATVYAVSDGADSGNPISVEVQIVEPEAAGSGATSGQGEPDGD